MPAPSHHFDIAIVGAGQAGGQAAAALRTLGVTGTIGIIGDEPFAPYERPPLSKSYLLGERAQERLFLRNEQYWQDQKIELLLQTRVSALDAAQKTLTTEAGASIHYDKLIWATGGVPRQLVFPEVPATRIFTIRTMSDIDRLQEALKDVQHATLIGGGYIGLEAAAVLRKLGHEVMLVEREERLLARVVGPEMSGYFLHLHQRHGVSIRLSAQITKAAMHGDRIALSLGPKENVETDILIVGIGIIPSVDVLDHAGADCQNGVMVNEFCQSNLPDVFAIGDCARFPCGFSPAATTRLESVQNANDQAKCVAQFIAGRHKPYIATPWFWSDQYDIKLQTAGLSDGYTSTVPRGDFTEGPCALLYFRENILCAVDAANAPLDFAHGRMLLGKTFNLQDPRLRDLSVPLKDLAQ